MINWRTPAAATAAVLALALSTLVAPAASAATAHTIAEVQGTSAQTPLLGQAVTVDGVITGDYRGVSGFRGLYLQAQSSAGIPGASDGIFVFLGSALPTASIGDLVRVTGTAGEFGDQTQISVGSAADVELLTASVGVPAAVPLEDTVTGNAREAFEGMRVEPSGEYYLTSTHQAYNFGVLWLSAGTFAVKSTEQLPAGEQANEIARSNDAKRLLVDDGYSIQVTNASHPGTQPFLTKDVVVRNGDRFVAPANPMILGQAFGDYRLEPSVPINDASSADYKPTFTTENPRPATSPDVGGDFSVASFNVENYFTDFGGDARGADNAEQFAIQKSKVVAGILGLGASVVTLEEIENSIKFNHPADTSLADLVDALNAEAGAGTWAYVPTPAALADSAAAATTDFITNAIIYKPAVATPVGPSFADIDETVWNIAREPIAQTFTIANRVVTIVGNHFKSKSPPTGSTDPEPADGQGFFNAERVAQAKSVIDFVKSITDNPAKSDDVLLLGDFNAYAKEDPIEEFTTAGFVDLLPTKTDDQYTYTFDGELGSLDHALATGSLAEAVTGVGAWGINSAEWSDRGYAFSAAEAGTPFRSSDHDPIKVGLEGSDGPGPDPDPTPVDIDLLSINDFHGRLEANDPAAGAAVLAGMVNSYRASNPNTVFAAAGDLIGASTFTSFIQKDEPTIAAFNEMGLDVSALGNHEFDQGRADLDDRVIPEASWDYLAANVYDTTTNAPAFDEYFVKQFGDVSVGFVGAVTEELPSLVSPAGISTLDVKPVVPEINRVADALSDGNEANGEADVVVLLVHEGAATAELASATDNSPFGRIVTGADANIDAIISGHTHLAYDFDVPIAGTDRTRPVLSSGQYGEKYGHTSLSVDPETGELLDISSEVLPLFGAFPPDQGVADIVADAVAVAEVKGAVKVGVITSDINRARQSGPEAAENRGGESTLGNLVADVQLWATQDSGTQIALMNPGGLRADLTFASSGPSDPDGNVTFKEAAAVQPFSNTLVTMTLTAAQLKSVLEQQWQPSTASRPFLKLGVSKSLKYTYDPTAAAGDHITAMYVNDELVTDADSYSVVVNSFLASGGDNFTTLAQGTARADSGKVDLQAMVDYFQGHDTVDSDYAQRSVGVTLSPAAQSYAPGDTVTLALSSLLFSGGEANGDTAVVSVGEQILGSGPIDTTIVDTTDEVGRASVTIQIPADAPAGTLALTVTVPLPIPSTSIDVPLTISGASEPEITSERAPKITGSAQVGRVLTATKGLWSVSKPKIAYQWNRDGEPISGATKARYRLKAADAGAAITVTVTASAKGYTDGTATSAAKTVRKLASEVRTGPARITIDQGEQFTYRITVAGKYAAGKKLIPTGDVVIADGSRVLQTVTLDAADKGRARVTVSGLYTGRHQLTATYQGNDAFGTSKSARTTVTVR